MRAAACAERPSHRQVFGTPARLRASEMALGTHVRGLGQPRLDLGVDVRRRPEPEHVHVVARARSSESSGTADGGQRGPARRARTASAPRGEGREAHPDLECDAGLLGDHGERPVTPSGADDGVERLPHHRVGAREQRPEVVPPTGVGLVAVREPAAAARALPGRPRDARGRIRRVRPSRARPAVAAALTPPGYGARQGASAMRTVDASTGKRTPARLGSVAMARIYDDVTQLDRQHAAGPAQPHHRRRGRHGARQARVLQPGQQRQGPHRRRR